MLKISSLNGKLPKVELKQIGEVIKTCLIQHFEADFLWKVSLKILNSGIILKTFTNVVINNSFLASGTFCHAITFENGLNPDQAQKMLDLILI